VGKEAPTEDLGWWTRDKKKSFSKQIKAYAKKIKEAAESAFTTDDEAEAAFAAVKVKTEPVDCTPADATEELEADYGRLYFEQLYLNQNLVDFINKLEQAEPSLFAKARRAAIHGKPVPKAMAKTEKAAIGTQEPMAEAKEPAPKRPRRITAKYARQS
jgi:hypothetical protein